MDFRIWPRMDRSSAEKTFNTVSLTSGPSINLNTAKSDFTPIGQRITEDEMQQIRTKIVEIAEEHGFKSRYGYDQVSDPGNLNRESFDRELTLHFREWAPMRWAEAGSSEIWSWFALALLPDITHWRWKFSSRSQKNEWNKERWIGGDLTRHTWARYWWRSVRFQDAPHLIEELSETDFIQLLERANSIGGNPNLLAAFGAELLATYQRSELPRRTILYAATQRMHRTLTYIDDASLDKQEIDQLVAEFFSNSQAFPLED